MFLLDTLDNLPRLRLSDSLMRAVIWVLRESGANHVPTFDRLRKCQSRLRKQCGVPSLPCKSPRGNVFFLNDPRSIIAKDWANPSIRPHIHVYPEIPDGPITEFWHAEKWRKDLDLDILSPMFDAGQRRHFYVKELSRLHDGQFVIPIRWLMYHGKVHADAFLVTVQDVSTTHFSANIPCHAKNYSAYMPNPDRKIAQGDPLYTSLIDYFADDVSGNQSKSWNKHWNVYMSHKNLPREMLQQEVHVHFISTSPHATIPEQFIHFKKAIETTHSDPVVVRDGCSGEATRFRIHINTDTSDNPMQSEVSGHIGGKSNKPCRKCDVGGSLKEKISNEGFHSLFETGNPRTKEDTLGHVKVQIALACKGVKEPVQADQTSSGVKDGYSQYWIDHLLQRFQEMKTREPSRPREEIQKELEDSNEAIADEVKYNPFLLMKGFDPSRDTPLEILHTHLLGDGKYAWHGTHTLWKNDDEKKALYTIRLQATNMMGLSLPPIRAKYIMQYANSLIGRQLKAIIQTAAFHVYDLVPQELYSVWLAVGELCALLWVPEIHNMEQYLHDVDIAVDNMLDAFAEYDPTKILYKVKLHISKHAVEDIRRQGPLIGVCTEGYESYNAVFRMCSILSNHLAPSRDISRQLADQESLKHRLTGGWWPTQDGTWVQAGTGIRDFLQQQTILQRLIGWLPKKILTPGNHKLLPLPKGQRHHLVLSLEATAAMTALNLSMFNSALPSPGWCRCKYIVSQSREECMVGHWVFADNPIANEHGNGAVVGRITDVLAENITGRAIALLEIYEVAATRHRVTNMPVLVERQGEPSSLLVPATSIQFTVNVQHDCIDAGCSRRAERPARQERVQSDLMEQYLEHEDTHRYIINTHAFHNAHLLRLALPRDLVAPIPRHIDRRAIHDKFAQKLRTIHDDRKTQAAARKAQKQAQEKGVRTQPQEESSSVTSQTGLGEGEASGSAQLLDVPPSTVQHTEDDIEMTEESHELNIVAQASELSGHRDEREGPARKRHRS
ncbi:hypothetical protein K474DRAFT_1721483 [Panus rudis PR-1116 ss-1]|nr:hypothetical protein K474DRAFT_1721483 [Panus rudis PR-1116 ss-1]